MQQLEQPVVLLIQQSTKPEGKGLLPPKGSLSVLKRHNCRVHLRRKNVFTNVIDIKSNKINNCTP